MRQDHTIFSRPATVYTVIGLSYVLMAIAITLGGSLDVLHAITSFHMRTNMLITMTAILVTVLYIAAFARRKIIWLSPQIILAPMMFVASFYLADCGPQFYYCVT